MNLLLRGLNSQMKDLKPANPTINSDVESDKWVRKESCCYVPVRYVVSVMTSLGLMMAYAQRVVLSQTIVAMVNYTAIPHHHDNIISCEMEPKAQFNTTSPGSKQDGSLVWDEYSQGLMLSSFYWGYTITQLPGGWLAAGVGGKWPMGISLLLGAILTLLSPITAEYDYELFLTLRIILGFIDGVIYPSVTALLSNWTPPAEKNLILNIAFSGAVLGTALIFPLSGFVYEFLGGWQAVFYTFGVLSIVWFVLWSVLVYESPACHPHISTEERNYIEESLGKNKPKIRSNVPWKAILTSRPMWALNVICFLLSWSYYVLLTDLPIYISNILRFPITENSLLMTLPYLTYFIIIMITSYFGDKIVKKGSVPLTFIRKGSTTIYILVSSGCLLAVTFVGCDRTAAVSLLVLTIGISGLTSVGADVNYSDIAPKYAGVAYALNNTFSNIAGIMGPWVVGLITQGQETIGQWNKVFYISIAMNMLGLVIFNLFISVEAQPWNYDDDDDDEDDEADVNDHESSDKRRLYQKRYYFPAMSLQ